MCTLDTRAQETTDVSGVTERAELSQKTEFYYRKVIELAKEEGIPILVTVSPYPSVSETAQAYFNRASDIADEYGVTFINYNLFHQELGLNYQEDVSDVMHLNHKGNQKYTRHLGKYLTEHYDLTDHRGDQKYDSWEQNSQWHLASIAYQEIVNCSDMERMFELLKDDDLDIIISVDSEYDLADGNLRTFLSAFSVPSDGTQGIWHISGTNVECVAITHGPEQVRQIRYPYHTLTMKSSGEENSVYFDTTQYKTVDRGVNVLICSRVTGEVVDSFGVAVYGDGIYK